MPRGSTSAARARPRGSRPRPVSTPRSPLPLLPCSMPVAADSGTAAAGWSRVADRGRRCSAGAMVADLVSPAKARPGDRVAILSPSFAAPGVAPAVHEQAMRRLTDLTGLVPVEYPTTRLSARPPRTGGRPQRRVRGPRHPCRAHHHRWRGPDHRHPAPQGRPRARRPQAVPRPQRQHQHPVVAVDRGRGRLLRRVDAGAAGPGAGGGRLPAGVVAGGAAHRRTPRGGGTRRVGGLRHRLGGPTAADRPRRA